LFRARAMHGDVIEQFPVERFRPGCLERRRRGRKCRFASRFKASGAPENHLNVFTDDVPVDDRSDINTLGKLWTKCDDVIKSNDVIRCADVTTVPKIVRRSDAWIDFSTTTNQLPVRNADQNQKPFRWRGTPRNAWMSQTTSVSRGLSFRPEQAVTDEFDVYRLRSFATSAGRIVNRGDYFRVRQRVHPSEPDPLEQRGFHESAAQTRNSSKGNSSRVAAVASPITSNSATSSTTIEYRPVVYYATSKNLADAEETFADDDDFEEMDFSDETTKLLSASNGDQTTAGYFSWQHQKGRLCGGRRTSQRRDDGKENRAEEPRSTVVPDNDEATAQSRVMSLVRVVLLGDRAVGKTTLACQLLTSEHLANRSSACLNFSQGKVASYQLPLSHCVN